MWSGSLISNYSGSITGAHQNINRISYRCLKKTHSQLNFPKIREIIHFEGKNGPDGIKAKSPGKDEPWHYLNPYDLDDDGILKIIYEHYNELVHALTNDNKHKAAFEAAWLSHALVDGLTPAHHYPYELELEKLRGEPIHTRDSIKKKIIIPGSTKIEMIHNNWKMWGAKGLFTTHGTFELGVALILMTVKPNTFSISEYDRKRLDQLGLEKYFRSMAAKVADYNLYERYYKYGWTTKIANDVKKLLIPDIINTVSVVWNKAIDDAESNKKS